MKVPSPWPKGGNNPRFNFLRFSRLQYQEVYAPIVCLIIINKGPTKIKLIKVKWSIQATLPYLGSLITL